MEAPEPITERSRERLAFIVGPVFLVLGVIVLVTERSPWEPVGRTGMPASGLALLFIVLGLACVIWALAVRSRRKRQSGKQD